MNVFIGEIRAFGFNFTPAGWLPCNGQLVPVSDEYKTLLAVIGKTFGGDGKNIFGIPNLNGNAIVGVGANPPLTTRNLGDAGGETGVTLSQDEMPGHNHIFWGATGGSASKHVDAPKDTTSYLSNFNVKKTAGGASTAVNGYGTNTFPNTTLNSTAITMAGGSLPHSNIQPMLPINYCICATAGDNPYPAS